MVGEPNTFLEEAMLSMLRILKNVVAGEPPQVPHQELEHLHWDVETKSWRRPEEAVRSEAA
jgi:hypothetical protein